MQIVIEIPEYVYEHAKEISEDDKDIVVAMDAIKCGTPLDKIRSEIMEFAKNPNFGDLSIGVGCGAMKALEIIDKYREESEK